MGNVASALLVSVPAQGGLQPLALWPSAVEDPVNLMAAARAVVQKKRLHLEQLEGNQLLLAHPLEVEGIFWGVAAFIFNGLEKSQLPSVLKQLKVGQKWLQLIVQGGPQVNQTAVTTETPAFGDSELALVASLLREKSLAEVCISLVNILASYLRAARVSVGLFLPSQKNLHIEAVSFSANFDRRSPSIVAVREAMLEAIDQGLTVDCVHNPSATEANTPQVIQRAHQQLVADQQVQRVLTLLIRKDSQLLGALTLEFDGGGINAEQQEFLQRLMPFVSTILTLHQQARLSGWQRIKQTVLEKALHWFGGRLSSRKWFMVAFAACILLLIIPMTYRVSANATLQASEKYLVVSPMDAYLGKISARPGDWVKQGAVLAQLKDDDLRLERRKLASQAQQYRQTYDSALANSDRVNAAIANAQYEQVSVQMQLIDQQLQRTQLSAPLDGMVISDDISQKQGTPVKQGDVLFEIAAGKTYRLYVYVDERELSLVKLGQAAEVKLTSLPNQTLTAQVVLVSPMSEVRDGRNYFRVELSLPNVDSATSILRPGMTGTGKILTEKRALGWIWFHDIVNWLRLSLW